MTGGVAVLLALCGVGLVGLLVSRPGSALELAGAILALASVLAIPVGYLMGTL